MSRTKNFGWRAGVDRERMIVQVKQQNTKTVRHDRCRFHSHMYDYNNAKEALALSLSSCRWGSRRCAEGGTRHPLCQ